MNKQDMKYLLSINSFNEWRYAIDVNDLFNLIMTYPKTSLLSIYIKQHGLPENSEIQGLT